MEEEPRTQHQREAGEPAPGEAGSGHTSGTTAVRDTVLLPEDARQDHGRKEVPGSSDGRASQPQGGSPERQGIFRSLFSQLLEHRNLATAIMAALIVAIIIATFAFVNQSNAPAADQIQSDARAALSNPAYAGGMFGSDDPLELQSVQIVEIERTRGGADPAAQVRVQAFLQSGSVDATVSARLDYEHHDDRWFLVGAPSEVAYSYHASSGVDLDKVRSSLDEVLAEAETSYRRDHPDEDDQTSLPTIYKDADVAVTGETFDRDAQTDVVKLHLSAKSSFSQRTADIEATFRFMAASGLWELSDATASDEAKAVDYSPLTGTWTGTFQSQNSSGAKCLAAKDHEFSLHVIRATSETIQGTLTSVAHLHEAPSHDQDGTEGDTDLSDIPFSGTREKGQNGTVLSFSCTTQDLSGGTVTLRLSFGTDQDDSAATASVISTHVTDKSLLFIPLEQTDTFEDLYELRQN